MSDTTRIVNLTPHPVSLIGDDWETTVIIPSSGLVRVDQWLEEIGQIEVDGLSVPIVEVHFGEVQGLPAPEPGTQLIVSLIAAQRIRAEHPERNDIVVIAKPVRDNQGRIVGAQALARV